MAQPTAYEWLHSYLGANGGSLAGLIEDLEMDHPEQWRGGQWSAVMGNGSVASIINGTLHIRSTKEGYDYTIDPDTGSFTGADGSSGRLNFKTSLPTPRADYHPSEANANVGHTAETAPKPEVVRSVARPSPYQEPAEELTASAEGAAVPGQTRPAAVDERGYARSLAGSEAWGAFSRSASSHKYLPYGTEPMGSRKSVLEMQDGSMIEYHHEARTKKNTNPKVTKMVVTVPHLRSQAGEKPVGGNRPVNPHTLTRTHVFNKDNVLVGMDHTLSANDQYGTEHTHASSHIIGPDGAIEEVDKAAQTRAAKQSVKDTYSERPEAGKALNSRRMAAMSTRQTARILASGSESMVGLQTARFGRPNEMMENAAQAGSVRGEIVSQLDRMAGWVSKYARWHPTEEGMPPFSPTPEDLENPGLVENAWKKIRGVMYNSYKERERAGEEGRTLEPHKVEQAEAMQEILSSGVDDPLNANNAFRNLPRSSWRDRLWQGLAAKIHGEKGEEKVAPTGPQVRPGRTGGSQEMGDLEVLEANMTGQHVDPETKEKYTPTLPTEHFHGATSVQELKDRFETAKQKHPTTGKNSRNIRKAVVKVNMGGEEKYITLTPGKYEAEHRVTDQPTTKGKHFGGERLRFLAYNPAADQWKDSPGIKPWSQGEVLNMHERAMARAKETGEYNPTPADLHPEHPAHDPEMEYNSGIVSDNGRPTEFRSVKAAEEHVKAMYPGQEHTIFPIHADGENQGEAVARDNPVTSLRAGVQLVRPEGSTLGAWYGGSHAQAVAAYQRHTGARDLHQMVHGPGLATQLKGMAMMAQQAPSDLEAETEQRRTVTNETAAGQSRRLLGGGAGLLHPAEPGSKTRTGVRKKRTFTPSA